VTLLVYLMVLALLMPVFVVLRKPDLWHRLAAFASISTKVSILMLVFDVVRGDRMIGVVGVIVLSVGNAGVMLLANLLRELDA
jgi:multicomponent Na+:H+ antiporter subunit F